MDPSSITAYRLAKNLAVPLTRVMAILQGRYDLDLARRESGARVDREVSPLSVSGADR